MNSFFGDSLLNSIVTAFLTAIGVGLFLGLFTPFLIDFQDTIFTILDKNSLIFVDNRYEPFRVGISMASLGSFVTFLILIFFEYKNKKKETDL